MHGKPIYWMRLVLVVGLIPLFLSSAIFMLGSKHSILRTRQLFNHISSGNVLRQARAFSMGDSKEKITDWVKPGDKSGEFKRQSSQFRNFISKEPGAKFPPEKDRYHLYVSYACPWAHRTLIVRKLKGLDSIIPYTSVHWHMGEKGWRFLDPSSSDDASVPGENVTPDPLHKDKNFTHLRHLYFSVNPEYDGRFTVPVLWDKKQSTIVSNESAEIIRMFYTAFDDLLDKSHVSPTIDLLPSDLEKSIDSVNEWTYNDINNGVYKSGFATTQPAYESAVTQLFKSLDRAERELRGPYYFGDRLTEADVRLFTTIVRFDVVYVQHFKCNLRDIRSGYPRLHAWLRNLYWNHHDAFGASTEFTHIKNHYTKSHKQINQFAITPLGPVPDILGLDEEVNAVKAATK